MVPRGCVRLLEPSRFSVDKIIHHYEVVRRSVIPVADVFRVGAKNAFARFDLDSGDYLRVERDAYEGKPLRTGGCLKLAEALAVSPDQLDLRRAFLVYVGENHSEA
jgi:hypothetical protein